MTSPNPKSDKHKHKTYGEHKAPDTEGPNKSAVPSGVPRTPVKNGPDHDEHRAKEEKYWATQNRWQKITGLAAIGAFVAAGIYAGYARLQVGASNTSNQLAQDNSEKQLRAYVEVAQVATKGLESVNEEPENGYGMDVLPLSPEAANQQLVQWYVLPVVATLQNTGNTPATDVQDGYSYLLLANGAKVPDKLGCPILEQKLEKMVIPAKLGYSGGSPSLGMDAGWANRIKNKSAILVVYGCTQYRDIFKHVHCSQMCAVFKPEANAFGFCEEHNAMDECQANY